MPFKCCTFYQGFIYICLCLYIHDFFHVTDCTNTTSMRTWPVGYAMAFFFVYCTVRCAQAHKHGAASCYCTYCRGCTAGHMQGWMKHDSPVMSMQAGAQACRLAGMQEIKLS